MLEGEENFSMKNEVWKMYCFLSRRVGVYDGVWVLDLNCYDNFVFYVLFWSNWDSNLMGFIGWNYYFILI